MLFYARHFASVSVFYEVFYASIRGCLAKFIFCLPQGRQIIVFQCMRISVNNRKSADVVIHVCGFFSLHFMRRNLLFGSRYAGDHSKILEALDSCLESLGVRQLLPVRFSQQCDSSCRHFFVGWICGGSGSCYSQSTQERPSGVFLALA